MFVALPTEIHDQIDAMIDGAIAKCPEAAGARADLRAQLVRYFCDWNHLPTPQNLSIERKLDPMSELIEEARQVAMLICPIPSQLEDGDVVERMPDDLLRAANIIGRLCDAIKIRDEQETGWVIEQEDSDPSRPMYYAGFDWSYDNLKAMRFARKEDAQTMCRYMFPGEPHRVADHMWCP